MKKLTSILLCACLMLNFVIVGVLPVGAATDTRKEVVNQNFDDTSIFTPDHATMNNKSGYWSVSVSDGTRPTNNRDTYVPFNTSHLDGGNVSGGAYLVSTTDGGEQESDVAHSGTQAVKGLVSWRYDNGASYLTNDQIITVWHYVQNGQGSSFKIMNGNTPTFQASMADGSADSRQLYVYDLDKEGGAGNVVSGLRFPTDTWVKITVVLNSVTKEARVSLTSADGSEQFATKTYRLQGEVSTNVVTVGKDNVTYTDDIMVQTLDLSNDDYAYLFASDITFDAGDGTLSGDNAITTDGHGKLATLPTATLDGYTFDGWYTAEGVKVTTDTVFTEDTTVTAKWLATVTFDGNGNDGGTAMEAQNVPVGVDTKLNANTFEKADYVFLGWSIDSQATKATWSDGDNINIAENTTLYAVWVQSDYTAAITTGQGDAATVGTTFTVTIDATGKTAEDTYNATQFVVSHTDGIEYTSIAGSDTVAAQYDAATKTVTVVDKGEAQVLEAGIYTLTFTVTDANTTNPAVITLKSIGFGTMASAVANDLTPAAITAKTVSVELANIMYNVSLPSIYNGKAQAEGTQDYTFTVETSGNAQYYTYDVPSVTMEGTDSPVVTGDATTGWTVKNVTGAITITGDRTPNSYKVTINGKTDDTEGAPATGDGAATYLTDYTFTIPQNVEAGLEVGYGYTLESVTIGGATYTGYTVDETNNRKYTIPGADVKGDIVITIKETEVAVTDYTVTVAGTGAGAAAGFAAKAKKGEDYTLTLTPVKGYAYTVEYAIGESAEYTAVTVTEGTNDYTVAAENITGALKFKVTATVDKTGFKYGDSEYLDLADGSKLWLVYNETKLEADKTYTYGGTEMFYSAEYNAYCTLIIVAKDADKPAVDAAEVAIVDSTLATLPKDGLDVNKSGRVDANDAQLTYNIYNKDYTDFDTVSMEKFLLADANGDKKVDVIDGTAIVNFLLGITQ